MMKTLILLFLYSTSILLGQAEDAKSGEIEDVVGGIQKRLRSTQRYARLFKEQQPLFVQWNEQLLDIMTYSMEFQAPISIDYRRRRRRRHRRRHSKSEIEYVNEKRDGAVKRFQAWTMHNISGDAWNNEYVVVGRMQGLTISVSDVAERFGDVLIEMSKNFICSHTYEAVRIVTCRYGDPFCLNDGLTHNEMRTLVIANIMAYENSSLMMNDDWSFVDSCMYKSMSLSTRKVGKLKPPCDPSGMPNLEFPFEGKKYLYHKEQDAIEIVRAHPLDPVEIKNLTNDEKVAFRHRMAKKCALVAVVYDGALKCNHSRLEVLIPQLKNVEKLSKECIPYLNCITNGFYMPGNPFAAMVPLEESVKMTRVRDNIRMVKRHYMLCIQSAAENFVLNYRSYNSMAYNNLGRRLITNMEIARQYKVCTREIDSICHTMQYASQVCVGRKQLLSFDEITQQNIGEMEKNKNLVCSENATKAFAKECVYGLDDVRKESFFTFDKIYTNISDTENNQAWASYFCRVLKKLMNCYHNIENQRYGRQCLIIKTTGFEIISLNLFIHSFIDGFWYEMAGSYPLGYSFFHCFD